MVLLIGCTLKVHAVEGKGTWDGAAYTYSRLAGKMTGAICLD